MPELVFGLLGDRLIHVSEVTRGLACECVCPKCKRRLVAKQGEIKQFHFGHEAESDCQGYAETALHLAAKQLLMVEKRIHLPRYGLGYRIGIPAQEFKFGAAISETPFRGIVPDIILRWFDNFLFVEIRVSHEVDDSKRQKIRNIGISCIEIDLSDSKLDSMEQLRQEVIETTNNKKWIFNRHETRLLKQVEQIRTQGQIPAWWHDCDIHTWYCPLTLRKFGSSIRSGGGTCTDCPNKLDYIQCNQTGQNYRNHPDYVVCQLALEGKA